MMNMGHIFAVHARLLDQDRDKYVSLSDCSLASVRNIYRNLPAFTAFTTAPELAQRIYDRGLDIRAGNNYFMRWAASHDNLPLMKDLYRLGADPGACAGYATRFSAANGNIDALEWLHGLGNVTPYLNSALANAARNGQIKTLQWLVDHGGDLRADDDFIMYHAACSGDSATLTWLKENNANIHTFNRTYQGRCALIGKIAPFDWCEKNGVNIDTNVVARGAAANGHTALLQWAHDRGGIADGHTLNRLAKSNNEALKSLIAAQRHAAATKLVNDAITSAITETQPPATIGQRLRGLITRQGPQ